jgi:hypothetical protein
MNSIKKVLDNKYLMDYIYEFDNSYRIKFKNEIIYKLDLLDNAHSFWYDKYKKAFYNNKNLDIILSYQNAFIDTIFLINPNIFFNQE